MRDFSDMTPDELRSFANALDEIARKAEEKERKKRRRPAVTNGEDQ